MKTLSMIASLFLLLFVSCSKSTVTDNKQAEPKSSVPDKIAEPKIPLANETKVPQSLDEQAEAQAYKLLTEHWSVCDESLVARLTNNFGGQALNNFNGHDYVELKDVSVKITSLKLTEADQLNGREWSGYAEFHAKAGRFHFPAGPKDGSGGGDQPSPRWDKWQTGDLYMLPTFWLHKDNGQWGSGVYQRGDLLEFIQTTPCDQVPK